MRFLEKDKSWKKLGENLEKDKNRAEGAKFFLGFKGKNAKKWYFGVPLWTSKSIKLKGEVISFPRPLQSSDCTLLSILSQNASR